MFKIKIQWFPVLLVLMLSLAACGQFSVSVVDPEESNPPGGGEVVATALPDTPVPSETPAPSPEPVQETSEIPAMVYVGTDNNLWILDAGSDAPRQLTTDANPLGGEGTAIAYESPRLSSDAALLAFNKTISTPSGDGGYDVVPGLWVMDLQTGEETQLHEGYASGMDWRPGSHLLAYGLGVGMEYFMSRGEPDPALAVGIQGMDLDSGEERLLVAPERGYALAAPQWSADGRFLAFSEIIGMEGSGLFAYYDFMTNLYSSWDEPVGPFSWSPNGGLVAYARQTYTATGEERLYIRERDGAEQAIGPDYDGPAYATLPVFSPDGSRIAYLAFLEGPETNVAAVSILDLASGETQSFGRYEGVWNLAWTPDGSHVIFQSGPWESYQITALDVHDGSEIVLAEGGQPALAGR